MEDKFAPIGEDNFNKLVLIISKITSHLPEHDAPFIWNMYNDTRGMNQAQPCTCGSSGRYWGEAVAHLKAWVKERVNA
jgi:hypothetical protein